jgi:predicted PurR-regulated permease PerM
MADWPAIRMSACGRSPLGHSDDERQGNPALIDRPTIDSISLVATLVALYAVLALGLLPALLSGLLVAQLVHATVPVLYKLGIANLNLGRAIALTLVTSLFVAVIALLTLAISARLTAGPENLFFLMQRMAEVIDTARNHLPPWASAYLPENIEEFEAALSKWLRDNAWQLRYIGSDVGIFIFHVIAGMIIGGMVAASRDKPRRELGPLAEALDVRTGVLSLAFRRIVFSQIRISALNTFLTAVYLAVLLPLFGVDLPFLKTVIAVTFLVGLLPVIGNLISNTVIVLVSFSVSPLVAVASLAYLVIIHKLEYFVNARIIGTRINAKAWELLLAMLVMDAWFGVPGLIAAPIYYAYLKEELTRRNLI